MRAGNLIIPSCVVKRIFPLGSFSPLSLCSLGLIPFISSTFLFYLLVSSFRPLLNTHSVPDTLPDSRDEKTEYLPCRSSVRNGPRSPNCLDYRTGGTTALQAPSKGLEVGRIKASDALGVRSKAGLSALSGLQGRFPTGDGAQVES